MPAGIPTATFAIGEAGATNAALFAISMLASAGNEELSQKLKDFREEQKQLIEASELPSQET
jgi:5-(carboxyamino)imidazole ribonucleotide mutase